MTFYILDSNPTDGRIKFMETESVPTITAHIHKASAVGPLVLISNESICNRESSERQPCDDRPGRDSTDTVVKDGHGREQHAVCPYFFYESRFAEWKPYQTTLLRAEGGTLGGGGEGIICYELLR